jgi:integrase
MTEIRFQDYITDYIDYAEDEYASNTSEKRIICLREFVKYFENTKQKIDTDEFYESVDKIKDYFKQDDVNVHGTKVSAVRSFLSFIGTKQDTRTNEQLEDIKEKISLSKLKSSSGEIGKMDKKELENKLLEDEEIESAKEAGSEKAALVIDLMLDTAARPGEIVGLKPEDIDFNKNSVHIQRTWSDAKGFVQMNPKHDSFRRVKISDSTSKDLREWVENNSIDESEFIFDSYRSDVYRPVKAAFTEAQVRTGQGKNPVGKTDVTPHWMRHNACTRLIQNGNSKEKVQEYMGHSSIQITEVYEHFDDSQVVDVELA